MSKRSFVNFEAVKTAVNITQVLEHYGPLQLSPLLVFLN